MPQGDFKEDLSLEEVRPAACRAAPPCSTAVHESLQHAWAPCMASCGVWPRGLGEAPGICIPHLDASILPPGRPPLLPAPQAIKLVVKVLSKTMDSTTLSPEKVELATLSRDEDAGQVGTGLHSLGSICGSPG